MEVIGPVSQNIQWQAKAGQGSDQSSFPFDWQQRQAICPQGKRRGKWMPGTDQHGHLNSALRFGLQDCRACPARALCPRSAAAARHLTVRTQAEWEVLQRARDHQQTQTFQVAYAQRSGMEGIHSQAV